MFNGILWFLNCISLTNKQVNLLFMGLLVGGTLFKKNTLILIMFFSHLSYSQDFSVKTNKETLNQKPWRIYQHLLRREMNL